MKLELSDAEATGRLGTAIAPWLRPGDAVLLYGDLGAGKSTLARALIRALTRPDEDVPSPTFTLVQMYEATPPLAHFDLYRLGDVSEVDEIGLDEALADGVAVIEWPQRLGDDIERICGPNRLTIVLEEKGDGRVATVSGVGSWEGRLDHVRL